MIERTIGKGTIERAGRKAPTVLVFAEDEDSQVLGLHTLEGLGLELDPTAKQLKEVEAILAI
jgi:predicted aspartyl protease